MTEFKAFWQNYVNFSDRTTRRGYWMAVLFIFIATIIASIVSSIIPIGPVIDLGMGVESRIGIIYILWCLALIVPSLAMSVRRLRDIGKHWGWLFINLVPLIGGIWYLILVCKPSVPDDGTPVV